MRDSENVFNYRIDKKHIQREEVDEIRRLYEKKSMILGIEQEEFEKLLNDLDTDDITHSNDMVTEMIISSVKEHTNDGKLKKILENINIAVISDKSLIGTAYPKYIDHSYYIEFGNNIYEKTMLLSDIFSVLFMYYEHSDSTEIKLLDLLLEANIQRFNSNVQSNDLFNIVQMRMLLFDKLKGNSDFTDHYVSYSREIYEMAIATLIGHEVGHHYFGHTDENIEDDPDPKNREFKSDCYGVDFAINYLQCNYKNSNNIYGIHQFAGIYIPLIVSSSFCNDIFNDGEKHPSIVKRIYNVQKELKMKLDQNTYQEMTNYIRKLAKKIQFPINIFR